MIYIIHIGNFHVDFKEDMEVSSSPKLIRTTHPYIAGRVVCLSPKYWRELIKYLPIFGSYTNGVFYSLPHALIQNIEAAQSILHEGKLLDIVTSIHLNIEETMKSSHYPTIRIETQTTEECLGQVRGSL